MRHRNSNIEIPIEIKHAKNTVPNKTLSNSAQLSFGTIRKRKWDVDRLFKVKKSKVVLYVKQHKTEITG